MRQTIKLAAFLCMILPTPVQLLVEVLYAFLRRRRSGSGIMKLGAAAAAAAMETLKKRDHLRFVGIVMFLYMQEEESPP
jgi:hypothetical protein